MESTVLLQLQQFTAAGAAMTPPRAAAAAAAVANPLLVPLLP